MIIFLLDGFGVGGTELNAARTLEALARRNEIVTVMHFQPDGPLYSRIAASGHPLLHTPVSPLWSPGNIPNLAALASAFSRRKARLVHSQDVYSNILGAVASRLSGTPIATSRRWKDDVPRAALTPLNAWAHRRSTLVLPNSGSLRQTLHQEGVRDERIVVHENFIDDTALVRPDTEWIRQWRRNLGLREDTPVVGCVARLSRVKRHDVLLEAFSLVLNELPDARLVLVGDGPEREQCESRIHGSNLEGAVLLTGTLPNTPLPQLLFDIAVLTSENEGFPNALVEAAACGVPLIAPLVGGVPDILADGTTGRAVPVADARATAETIVALLRDPDARRRMGAAGRAAASSRFTESAACERLLGIYSDPRRQG